MNSALRLALVVLAASPARDVAGGQTRWNDQKDLAYEATITDLQSAMVAGRTTSVALVDAHLARIRAYDHAGPALNAVITAFLDEHHFDALIYPTMRRKAAIIGEPTRGATCELSAVTGLPALSMPAGFTPDGMPIGMEWLGRPLADTALVAMAFDYEQSTRLRRAPATTPPLVDGRRPPPTTFAANARSGAAAAHATFVYDETRRALQFDVRITGVPPATIFGASITHDSAGTPGPAVHQLSRPAQLRSTGVLVLRDDERVALVGGGWSLALFAHDALAPSSRGALVVKSR